MSIYDLTYKNTQLKALYREAFNIDVYGFWKFQQLQKIEPSIFITLIDIIYYQNPRKLSCVCSLFIIVLTNRKVHLPDNNGMLSADVLLIHAVTTVYFQYPTRREHWPQYPCFHVKVLHV